MEDTQAGLDEQVLRVEHESKQVNAGLLGLVADLEAARERVAEQQAASQAERRVRAELEQQATDLSRTIGQQERAANDLAQQQALIEQRQESSSSESDRVAREAKERTDRITQLESEVAAFEVEDARIAAATGELEGRLLAIAREAEAQTETLAAASASLATAERRLG
jgi:chromosome segregation ATPase